MNWLAVGAIYCALSIAAGAFGAHGLAERLSAERLVLWETGSRYLVYSGLGLIAVGLLARQNPAAALSLAGWSLTFGALLFSGTVLLLAFDVPRWLGAITPLGGVGMIVGFVALAVAAIKA